MVQLDCIEDGCTFKTQDLDFDNAEKILDMHLKRSHPVGGGAPPVKPSHVQLQCDKCEFITQELPQDQAERLLKSTHERRCPGTNKSTTASATTPASSGPHYVKLSGMVWSATNEDIKTFLSDVSIKNIKLIMNDEGRPSGIGVVEVMSEDDVTRAMRHNRQHLGARFVIVEKIDQQEYNSLTSSGSRSASVSSSAASFSSNDQGFYLKLSGMVWSATEDDIKQFLSDVNIKKIKLIKTETGRASGTGVVEVASSDDVARALRHDRQRIRERFVIVERITQHDYNSLISFS